MIGVSSQIVVYLKDLIINNLYIPAGLTYVVLMGLVLLSVALIFRGSQTWKIMFAVLGAYYGYIFTSFIIGYLPVSGEPFYLTMLVGIVLGALIVTFFVRIALSAGIAAIGFFILFAMYPSELPVILAACVIAFAITYVLYNRVTMVVAGVLGAFLLWFALVILGLASIDAQIVAGLLYIVGLYVQMMEKYRKNRTYQPAGVYRRY